MRATQRRETQNRLQPFARDIALVFENLKSHRPNYSLLALRTRAKMISKYFEIYFCVLCVDTKLFCETIFLVLKLKSKFWYRFTGDSPSALSYQIRKWKDNVHIIMCGMIFSVEISILRKNSRNQTNKFKVKIAISRTER